jgi:hypothetical protein
MEYFSYWTRKTIVVNYLVEYMCLCYSSLFLCVSARSFCSKYVYWRVRHPAYKITAVAYS